MSSRGLDHCGAALVENDAQQRVRAEMLVKSPTVGCIQTSEGRTLADRVLRAAHARWASHNQLCYDHSANGARKRVEAWSKLHQLNSGAVWRLLLDRSGSRTLAIAIDIAAGRGAGPTLCHGQARQLDRE